MTKSLSDCTTLNNGLKMPWFGLGVYKAQDGAEVENAVKAALEAGYRSIDTAAFYENEVGVGKAVRESGIHRQDVFITTKVWNSEQGYESTFKAFAESNRKLGLEYVDLYLIHWPVKGKYKETWKALEKIYKEGLVRAIGVSNFQIHHLKDLMADSEFLPMVNQVEFHPRLTQKPLLKFCRETNIQLEAWAPLMRGQVLDDPVVVRLADKYGKTPAQIILRWDLQLQVVTIPKSIHRDRIIENAQVFDFELTSEEIRMLDGLNMDKRTGPDPDNFSF
ncbi:MAG: aldo/keto reductase [Bacillota bacterium]